MNNGNETLGLSVISTIPEAHQTNVNVNKHIEIKFSGDINKSTLNNSIIVFEDYNGVYNGITSLKSSEQFNIVKGTLTYADRIIKFKPKEPLNIDTKYIVVFILITIVILSYFNNFGVKLTKKRCSKCLEW